MNGLVKIIDILLVEDSEGDVRLIREALKDGKLLNNLHVAKNGVEAMDFLLKRGKFQNAQRPDLVILDLNLPKKNGHEVLAEIKADENLKRIPVVILTTSNAETDKVKTYNLHANCYIVKPLDMFQFMDVVKHIESFWFGIVELPEREKK